MTKLIGTKANGEEYSIDNLLFIRNTENGGKKFAKALGGYIILNADGSIESITAKARRTMARDGYEA